MPQFIKNIDSEFTNFESIQLSIDPSKKTQEITYNSKTLQIKTINTLAFMLRRFKIQMVMLLFVLVFSIYNFPIISFLYIAAAALTYLALKSLCKLRYINTLAFLVYLLTALIFAIYMLNKDLLVYEFSYFAPMVLGSFIFHMTIVLFAIYQKHSPVYQVEDPSQEHYWYFWPNPTCKKDTK